MYTRTTIAECTEHVLSIQPTYEEPNAFQAFDVEGETLWPPLVLNYIHRWMHRESLYNIRGSKATLFSELTDSLLLRAKLPNTDDVRSKVAMKCSSLIRQSTSKWKEDGLLVQRGYGIGKHKELRDAWAAHVESFEKVETAILEGMLMGRRANDDPAVNSATASDGEFIRKRRVNDRAVEHPTKKPRSDHHSGHGGDENAQSQLDKNFGLDLGTGDCIVVDVGKTAPQESGLPESQSLRYHITNDPSGQESHLGPLLDASIHTLSAPVEVLNEQAVHIAHGALSVLASIELESKIPSTTPGTVAFKPGPSYDSKGVPTTHQDQTQKAERISLSSHSPSTALSSPTSLVGGTLPQHSTTPHGASLLAPKTALTEHTSTTAPNSDHPSSPDQASEHLEEHRSHTSTPLALSASDAGPCQTRLPGAYHIIPQASEQAKEHRPNEPTSPARSVTGVDQNATCLAVVPSVHCLASPDQPSEQVKIRLSTMFPNRNRASTQTQGSGHIKNVRPRNSTTLEPVVYTNGPSSTIAPNLHSRSSNEGLKHVQPRRPAILKLHSPAQSTSNIPRQARPLDTSASRLENPHSPGDPKMGPAYKHATPAARCGNHTTSQQFQLIGKFLVPEYSRPSTWFVLHVDMLMTKSVSEFYEWFSELLKVGRIFPTLRFELLDFVSGEGPEQAPRPPGWSRDISHGDHGAFQALKKFIFKSFVTSIAEDPGLDMFRIVVAPPELVIFSPQLSKTGSVETGSWEPSRINLFRMQPLAVRSSLTQIPSTPLQSRLGREGPQELHPGPRRNTSIFGYNENPSAGPSGAAVARDNYTFNLAGAVQRPTRNGPVTITSPHPFPSVVVRIQLNEYGSISRPYRVAVLASQVKNVEFFAWFAKETGCGDPEGPAELRFSFKDMVPTAKINIVTRGNEEHFEYIKRDIKPMCGRTAVCMPGLSEFTILITVPGWVIET